MKTFFPKIIYFYLLIIISENGLQQKSYLQNFYVAQTYYEKKNQNGKAQFNV